MKKPVRRGDPQRERQWQRAVRHWQKSGQSVRDYCRVHGLKESAFYFWRRQLGRRGSAGPQQQEDDGQQSVGKARYGERASAPLRRTPHARPDEARFLPVHVVMGREQANAGGVEIVVGDGRMVRVQPGLDRQLLADVLAVLEVRPC